MIEFDEYIVPFRTSYGRVLFASYDSMKEALWQAYMHIVLIGEKEIIVFGRKEGKVQPLAIVTQKGNEQ